MRLNAKNNCTRDLTATCKCCHCYICRA